MGWKYSLSNRSFTNITICEQMHIFAEIYRRNSKLN